MYGYQEVLLTSSTTNLTICDLNYQLCRHGKSLYPRSTEGGLWVYWIHPDICRSVCPSVRPSVCRQGFRNFFKKLLAQFISYLAFTLMGWVSWPLFIHCVPSLIFGPLVAKYLAENGVSGFVLKNYWFHSLHTWHLPLGGYLDEIITGWGG